jgi:integrase/recombinase XerD
MLGSTTKVRTKAMIHFLASTGVRPGALPDPVLGKKHLVDMPLGCIGVRIYDNSKEGYWAFLTPEASTALALYLNTRIHKGEIMDEESPLFAKDEGKRFGYLTNNHMKGS